MWWLVSPNGQSVNGPYKTKELALEALEVNDLPGWTIEES